VYHFGQHAPDQVYLVAVTTLLVRSLMLMVKLNLSSMVALQSLLLRFKLVAMVQLPRQPIHATDKLVLLQEYSFAQPQRHKLHSLLTLPEQQQLLKLA